MNPHNLNGPPASSAPSSPASSNLTETIEIAELGTTVTVPKATNYGIGAVEKELLLEDLPVLSAQAPFLAAGSHFNSVFDSQVSRPTVEVLAEKQADAVKTEMAKLNAFAKVIDLQNANARGIAYENRRRIVLEFSGPQNQFDPGRAEVQGEFLPL